MEITRWTPIRAWMPALKKPRAASVDRGSWALFILLARTECPRDLSKSQDRDLVQGLQQLPALARPSGDEMCPPWAEPVSHRHGHPAPSCSTREAQNGSLWVLVWPRAQCPGTREEGQAKGGSQGTPATDKPFPAWGFVSRWVQRTLSS